MSYIEIKDLSFKYPNADDYCLKDVDLSFEAGELVLICGLSGSGKTTLLKHLKAQLIPAGERNGRVVIDGKEVDPSDDPYMAGYVFQNPDWQIVTDKVYSELAFGLENMGLSQSTMTARVAETAQYFGLDRYYHMDTAKLSGGTKQLLNLASVMVTKPAILLLDEPLAQLDPISSASFIDILRRINEEFGTTVIMTAHRLDDVFEAADKVVVLDKGTVKALGKPLDTAYEILKNDYPISEALPKGFLIYEEMKREGLLSQAFKEGLKAPLCVKDARHWLRSAVKQIYPENRQKELSGMFNNDMQAEKLKKQPVFMELKDIFFCYDNSSAYVLKGVDLKIYKGKVHVISGSNGCGKTTLLEILAGCRKDYRGKRSTGKKKAFPLVPQDPSVMLMGNTLKEEMTQICNDDKKTDEILEELGIRELKDINTFDLSGGQQQLAAFAKAMLADSDIMFMDEPTKGIDAAGKKRLLKMIERLRERNVTVVMVTHDTEFAAEAADYAMMLFDGRIVRYLNGHDFFLENEYYTTDCGKITDGIMKKSLTIKEVLENVR